MTRPESFSEDGPAVPESVPRLRHAAVAYAQRIRASDDVIAALKLAVTEAVTNAVMHAYVDMEPGQVRIGGWVEGERLAVCVRDEGRGMQPRLDSPGLGLGLPLIAQMADEVDVIDRPGDPGTTLHMWFSLAEARERQLSVS